MIQSSGLACVPGRRPPVRRHPGCGLPSRPEKRELLPESGPTLPATVVSGILRWPVSWTFAYMHKETPRAGWSGSELEGRGYKDPRVDEDDRPGKAGAGLGMATRDVVLRCLEHWPISAMHVTRVS